MSRIFWVVSWIVTDVFLLAKTLNMLITPIRRIMSNQCNNKTTKTLNKAFSIELTIR